MLPPLQLRVAGLAVILAGLGAAEPAPRDLASLAAAERELAAAYQDTGTDENRWPIFSS